MALQIDLGQLISAIAWLSTILVSVVWLFGKILVRQFKEGNDKQLVSIQESHDRQFASIKEDLIKRSAEEVQVAKQLREFETDFLKFQRDLPIQYVRREDYIRGQSVIESKLDALYSKLETVQIQGAKNND